MMGGGLRVDVTVLRFYKNNNMNRRLLFAIFSVMCLPVWADIKSEPETTLYNEPYRPQYHFTPRHRWIGDPCGLVKADGRFLAYSWGASESPDLVHWTELNGEAMTGVPENIAEFTGSVVVDRNNTAGYGNDVYLAAFTSFDKESKKQSQSIAFSRDRGVTYQYYDLNPVIDIWSTEFRDPTVIYDARRSRWVMLVAKALEKKVAFYVSSDFKNWTPVSEFGPMGDSDRSWECPDMFRVPVEGNTGESKWVLLVSVNWAREQYFVGDFDGEKFIPERPDSTALYVDAGLDYYASRVFQNYDSVSSPVYTVGWINTWDYAPQAPSKWGKGVWSLPREYRLKPTSDGYRLIQKPAVSLQSLRGDKISIARTLKPGVTPFKRISALGNCFEMSATFSSMDGLPCGFYFCEGNGRRLVVSYDPASGRLTVDRTNSADTDIPKFSRIANAEIIGPDKSKIDLHVFVDRSTVEIFANDGEQVFTLLTYAGMDQTGVSAFSLAPACRLSMDVWPMRSIHN